MNSIGRRYAEEGAQDGPLPTARDHMLTSLRGVHMPSPERSVEAGSEEVFKREREGWGAVGATTGRRSGGAGSSVTAGTARECGNTSPILTGL